MQSAGRRGRTRLSEEDGVASVGVFYVVCRAGGAGGEAGPGVARACEEPSWGIDGGDGGGPKAGPSRLLTPSSVSRPSERVGLTYGLELHGGQT